MSLNENSPNPAQSADTAISSIGDTQIVPAQPPKPYRVSPALLHLTKRIATVAIAGAAILIALMGWQYYVTSPWTRNGSVRVQVANVAPQVSGRVISVNVTDNQMVRRGDVLYEIDSADYVVAVNTAKARVDQTAADMQVKQAQSARRQQLSFAATTPEEQQIYAGNALQAKAAYEAALQQQSQAELNLERTKIISPANGYVTNLLLRTGDFAVQGQPNISVIDSDSFWIDGYFEETKLARICAGDTVEAKLMGYADPILGHVHTITRGISVANAQPGTQGLPNVNPIYTWVRLAQRVPIRVVIDHVPDGVPLVSGLTATVSVHPSADTAGKSWFGRARSRLAQTFSELIDGPSSARAGCLTAPPQVVREKVALSN